ncbi:bifunctional DNA primase/polymerase [Nonomuraea sp. NPDC050663]|uniref:bifunctional DNA primase/polymerase n=1 Tax=Nonomuraea sp. NPDC050663 TaxID=3364370 RepID=UPI0037958666
MTPPNDEHAQFGAPHPQPIAIARWCARQGWPVHPLAPGRKTPAANCRDCRQADHPGNECPCHQAGRWCHGFHAATTDAERITDWWTRSSQSGVGVACGPAGLVVIDIDAHRDAVPDRGHLLPGIPIPEEVDLAGLASGYHTLGLLAALRGAPDPAHDTNTLRVRTPSGGLHVWYRTNVPLLCSAGSNSGRALAWQVDIRASGGYIIAPGTRTTNGTYTAVDDCRQPQLLPLWLLKELVRTGHLRQPDQPAPSTPRVPPRALQALIRAGGRRGTALRTLDAVLEGITACSAVPEGAAFTTKLNRAAYTVGGLVAAGYVTQAEAESLLTEAADYARPGQHRRCQSIIRSGLAAGARRPLSLEGRS